MPLIGAAYSPWFFVDGRADSLWSQALGPLENPLEHGGSRTRYAHLIGQHYRQPYEEIFGPLPDLSDLPGDAGPLDGAAGEAWQEMSADQQEAVTRVYVNMGKALAAYQRKLTPGPSRFDRYVQAAQANDLEGMRAAFEPDEAAGLRLFIGEAECIDCHNGPLLTNNSFSNVATPASDDQPPDSGRSEGAQRVLESPFNCLGPYSDAQESDCAELKYIIIGDSELVGAFRTPSLRNVSQTAPYMHAGQFPDLRSVIEHYNRMPQPLIGHHHLEPLEISERQVDQLEAFLRTLDSPPTVDPEWLGPP
jgi:cytochrome c peroxidase